MALVYVSTLLFAFVLSLAPSMQFPLDPVFSLLGVGVGFKTPLIDLLILMGMLIIFIHSPGARVRNEFVRVFKWWLPWILYLMVRSSFAGVGLWKFEMYIARLLIPTMAIALVYIARPDKFEKYFFGLLMTLGITLVPLTYLYDFSEQDFYNNIWLSRMLGICALYLFINMKLKFNFIINVSLFIVYVVAMILIGSRGPVLSLLVTIAVYFILKNRSNVQVMLRGAVVALVAVVIIVALTNRSFESKVSSFLSHGKVENIGQIEEADDRTGVYGPTFDIFLDSPVFGVGLGKWSKVYYENTNLYYDGEYKYPHNFLLEIASELGVVGLILFVLLFTPYKRIFTLSNRYNIFILLGFLFAATSSDITQNSAPLVFGMLSLLSSRQSFMKLRKRKKLLKQEMGVTQE